MKNNSFKSGNSGNKKPVQKIKIPASVNPKPKTLITPVFKKVEPNISKVNPVLDKIAVGGFLKYTTHANTCYYRLTECAKKNRWNIFYLAILIALAVFGWKVLKNSSLVNPTKVVETTVSNIVEVSKPVIITNVVANNANSSEPAFSSTPPIPPAFKPSTVNLRNVKSAVNQNNGVIFAPMPPPLPVAPPEPQRFGPLNKPQEIVAEYVATQTKKGAGNLSPAPKPALIIAPTPGAFINDSTPNQPNNIGLNVGPYIYFGL